MNTKRRIESLTLVALVAVLAGCGGGDSTEVESEEAFLEQIRQDAGISTGAAEMAVASQEDLYPKIAFDSDTFEMGVIQNDRLAHREMKVYNRGKAPLRISKVTTSCGCTTGKMRKAVIPAGGEGILDITVDPARIPGFYTVKVLTIFTDDPINPFPKINVATHVEPELEFEPTAFKLGSLEHGVGAEAVIHARQLQTAPMLFSGLQVRSESPYVVAELEEVPEAEWRDPSKREYLIHAKLTADAPPGNYKEVIYINTNLARHKNVPLTFDASVVGPYSLSSNRVALRDIAAGELYKNALTLRSGEELEILEITSLNEEIEVTHRPGEEPNTSIIDVMVNESSEARLQRDKWTLTFKTGGKEFTETIDVSLVLKRAG